MMCTAAVCPIPSSPSPSSLVGFRHEEDEADSKTGYCSTPDRTWRSRDSSSPKEDLTAAFWLSLSPMADKIDIYRHAKFNLVHLNSPSKKTPIRIDIVSKLPVELSLAILQLLSEQDLCSVCQVCRNWYYLAHDQPLLTKRRTYVQAKRQHYRQFRENYSGTQYTPPNSTITRNSSSLSPLCPLNTSDTSRQDYRDLNSPSDTPPDPLSPRVSMSSVVDSVQKLSIQGDTRRCLVFPGIESSTRRASAKESTAATVMSPRQRRQSPFYRVGKNKERLRRL